VVVIFLKMHRFEIVKYFMLIVVDNTKPTFRHGPGVKQMT